MDGVAIRIVVSYDSATSKSAWCWREIDLKVKFVSVAHLSRPPLFSPSLIFDLKQPTWANRLSAIVFLNTSKTII